MAPPFTDYPTRSTGGFFEKEFVPLYVEKVGRPGLPIRLLVGLHFLKHALGESEESVVERFVENLYWQYICEFVYFQHTVPLDPTSLVLRRKRIKPEEMEKLLLQETIATAQREDLHQKANVARVNADTTVQEGDRLHDGRAVVPEDAEGANDSGVPAREGIELRKSYELVGTKAFVRQSRYAHARRGKRAKRET